MQPKSQNYLPPSDLPFGKSPMAHYMIRIGFILIALLIVVAFTAVMGVSAQTESPTSSAARYVSPWTEIAAQQSVVFQHGLHDAPLELNVWVYWIGKAGQKNPVNNMLPYKEFGDQIQVVKVSAVEIIVANNSHHTITVRVVAKP